MKVFKFGGASVKDANAVRNVSRIIQLHKGEKIIVVISAMGKTTNALEEVAKHFWSKDKNAFIDKIDEIHDFHSKLIEELFDNNTNAIKAKLLPVFESLKKSISKEEQKSFDFEYAQIVSIGEIISTLIVNEFLKVDGINSNWADARKLIRTNHNYREAEIDWNKTETLIHDNFLPLFDQYDCQVTQGFIGHTSDYFTTTLGREGSDFTAGIFAFCANADNVTIWKDVPGMLNADPKFFSDTIKLDQISFREAIELSYYGASVIHPKTIKPLQNKEIPLYVKSFIHPEDDGTIIQSGSEYDHLVPSFIFKHNQVLISFTPRDFSFIVEENLSDIFMRLSKANAKINLMQNSALSFSVLLDEDKIDLQQLLGLFENHYTVKFNENLELVTIRHYDQKTLELVTTNKEVFLEQKTRETARLVLKPIF
ncbi:MAG: aspartate kinase [Bacteroidota bacterium]